MEVIPLTKGYVTIIDKDDAPMFTGQRWHAVTSYRTPKVYAGRRVDGHIVKMHRVLTSAPSGMTVDHINGDSLDNRRTNLRVCTQRNNLANTRVLYGGSSRFKGVTLWHGYWRARIGHDNRVIGYFHDEIEAANAYDAEASRIYGEYAATNEMLGLLVAA